MTQLPPYTCPRCGYKSTIKTNFHNHLYKKKKVCPVLVRDIELTEARKEYLMENRIMLPEQTTQPQPTPQQTFNSTINNFNIMNNYINKLDPIDKITKYVEHNDIQLIDFEKHVEQTYERSIHKFENDEYIQCKLDKRALMNIIDDITTFKDKEVKAFNVIHDEVSDKIKMYQSGRWNSQLFDDGIDDIVYKLKTCYLDFYESYLIRKAHKNGAFVKQQMKELLKEYYMFIISFNLDPYVKDQTDGDLLGDESMNDRHDTCEEYHSFFIRIREDIKHMEVKRIRKDVGNIIRKNNKSNLVDLNSKVLDLIQADEEFRSRILERLSTFQRETIAN